jgi:hypothetical protein
MQKSQQSSVVVAATRAIKQFTKAGEENGMSPVYVTYYMRSDGGCI